MTELAPDPTERDSGLQASRRGLLAATGGGAAALAGLALLGSAEAAQAAVPTTSRLAVGDGPFVAYVESAKTGRVIVFAGNGATSFIDKTLVNSIVAKAGE